MLKEKIKAKSIYIHISKNRECIDTRSAKNPTAKNPKGSPSDFCERRLYGNSDIQKGIKCSRMANIWVSIIDCIL